MNWQTADLCDAWSEQLQIACPGLRHFGGMQQFQGPIATLKLFEDNSLVRSTLETPGEGRVLVVDGGGSLRCALLGDQLGELAVRNGWAGLVIHGCVRDSVALGRLPLGVYALASHPLKSHKRGEGQSGLTVQFAGVRFTPGEQVYVDADGLLVARQALHLSTTPQD
ncbi:ribonuclease E activity regulator RraA [Leeia aquatica]|uniref:4-hydroxy-4-methyl-2-oxoglutarate aldolase n=1 Tax=Leeia aquatica TaxID=2725557 RepID=A0A847S8A5_9NEIS|nr:ribonuclease E activity regulator RraA [Leeia aquatica]NLR75993.1 ribonuclease E activity regulator RraA [Leeia aquatica]